MKYILFSLGFIFLNGFSQDKIILINGKIIEGKVLNVSEDSLTYLFTKKNKSRAAFLESYRVFSIEHADGKEQMIYKYDSAYGNWRKEDELRSFIYGEQDAWVGYKPTLSFALSFLVAGGGGYALGGTFPAVIVPFATYVSFMILFRAGVDKRTVRNPKYLADANYIEGYKRIATSKKNRNALWGSVLGTGTGYAVFLLAEKNKQ